MVLRKIVISLFIGFLIIVLAIGAWVIIRNRASAKAADTLSQYLDTDNRTNLSQETTKSVVSFEYSTEGASLFGIYDKDHKLKYLGVDILGEMGRQIHEYTFANDYLIYSCLDTTYSEPFYMDSQNVKVLCTDYRRYYVYGGQMYDCTNASEVKLVSKAFQNEKFVTLQAFMNTLGGSSSEYCTSFHN